MESIYPAITAEIVRTEYGGVDGIGGSKIA
jgi:hypothetical protein